ncbi:Autophagy-related protein 18 [Fusarium oxysporum f. sp. albedinis]|nr:Autophagy-related protein 18 [Fusarium oxysporum f. sp. albedinis]
MRRPPHSARPIEPAIVTELGRGYQRAYFSIRLFLVHCLWQNRFHISNSALRLRTLDHHAPISVGIPWPWMRYLISSGPKFLSQPNKHARQSANIGLSSLCMGIGYVKKHRLKRLLLTHVWAMRNSPV